MSHVTLTRLKRQAKRLGITHDRIAAEAAKTSLRGSVSRTMVAHTFAGRTKSANVVATARRLIAEAKQQEQRLVASTQTVG